MTNSNGTGTALRLTYDAVVAGYIHDISDRNTRAPREDERDRDIEPACAELAPQAA